MVRAQPQLQIGQWLLSQGLISQEQLDSALAAQADAPTYLPLGRILVEQKAISERQLSFALERAGGKRLRLGEVLVRSGLLTQARLEHALGQQERLRLPLGQVLIKLGFITDPAMRQALGIQLNIPFVDLDRQEADPRLARLINANYARRHVLVPVAQAGETLTVCMDDPTNTSVIDELAASTGFVVNAITAAHDSIRRAFQRLYGQPIDTPSPVATSTLGLSESIEISTSDGADAGEGAISGEFVAEQIHGKSADAAVRHLLAVALDRRCSDIHLEMLSAGTHVRFRSDGVLREIDLGTMQDICDRGGAQVISRIKVLAKLDIAERRRPQDGSFRARIERSGQTENIDFRVSIIPGYYGESCVLRILDKKNAPTSLDSLGFSPAISNTFRQLLKRPAGILLVAGPTGSGKSTTLYAALMAVYRPEIRVLTAEDPIEYVYEQFTQSEVNERVGNTFARYLRAFLRHDPEVILVGEIRDEETAEMAFRAAQTGHLLLSTLHSNDSISTVSRLLDLNVDPNLIASSLLGVLAQRLVRCVCPKCRQKHEPAAELVREFFPTRPESLTFYQGTGCAACNFTGYKGRTCIAELWAPDAEDMLLISKRASFDEIRVSATRTTVSMAQDVMDRLVNGRTSLEELIRLMPYSSVHEFRRLVTAGLVEVPGTAGPVPLGADAEPQAPGTQRGPAPAEADAAQPEPEAHVLALEPEPARGEPIEVWEAPDDSERTGDQHPAAGDTPEIAGDDRMIEAFRQLDRARSLTEVLTFLADHAAEETGRVAILTVANSRLRVWTQRGWDSADSAAIDTPIVPNTVFDLAVTRGQPVSTSEAPVGGDGDPLTDLLASRAQGTGLAVPISVGGSAVAILYADRAGEWKPGGAALWRERLEILVRHAGWCLEGLTKSSVPSGGRPTKP